MIVKLLLPVLLLISEGAMDYPSDCVLTECRRENRDIEDIDYLDARQSEMLSCDVCDATQAVSHWVVERLVENEGNYIEQNVLTVNSSFQMMSGEDIHFRNVSVLAEGRYRCYRQNDEPSCIAGCLIVLAPGMFENPGIYDSESKDFEAAEAEVNGSYTFDTAAIYSTDMSGPCNLNQTANQVLLTKLDDGDKNLMYGCAYVRDRGKNSTPCQDHNRVRVVRSNTGGTNDSNAFNFALELPNLQLNDSGRYMYEAIYFLQGSSTRTIKKYFLLDVLAVNETSTVAPTPSSGSGTEPQKKDIGRVVGSILAAVVVVVVVMVSVIALIIVCRRRQAHSLGNMKLASDYNDSIEDKIERDLSFADQRPRLDANGRPISYIDAFPEDLSNHRDSDTRTI